MVAQSVVTCILIIFIQITGQIVDNFQVQDNRAIVNFPETIDFVLTLSTDIPVKRITLIYGTNAASCSHGGARQPQAFDSDTVIEIEWEWDLKRSGSLPPGAEIWWQWEIEDGNGGIFMASYTRDWALLGASLFSVRSPFHPAEIGWQWPAMKMTGISQ